MARNEYVKVLDVIGYRAELTREFLFKGKYRAAEESLRDEIDKLESTIVKLKRLREVLMDEALKEEMEGENDNQKR